MFRKLAVALVVVLLLFALFEWLSFPDVAQLAKQHPETTAFMEQRRQELRRDGKDDTLSYHWTPYARISPYLRRAVLVAEDDTFYTHGGVDVRGLEGALKRDWERRAMTHGGSTITQQLAKNLYLSPSRNPVRKAKEMLIARSLEDHLTKKQILELYLNVVEMGERTYGAEAAARHYFGKSASALTPSEAALLAGCLPNPRIMNPGAPNKRLRWRQRMILSRMKRWGYLMEREVLTARKPAEAPPTPASQTDTVLLEQTPPADPATPSTGTAATAPDSTATSSTATSATTGETTASSPPP